MKGRCGANVYCFSEAGLNLANSEMAKAKLNYNRKVEERSVNKRKQTALICQSILLLFKKTRVASTVLSVLSLQGTR